MSAVLLASVLVGLVALDAVARRFGAYASTAARWPAGFREVARAPQDASPYREHHGRALVAVVSAGIPRSTSIFVPPVLAMVLLWSLAVPLALGDFQDVLQGKRPVAIALATLALCAARAISGLAALVGVLDKGPRVFLVASAWALGLDIALAVYPLPCSDVRTDDVTIALVGAAAHAALTLGFVASLWMRRGLVVLDKAAETEDSSGSPYA